MELATMVFALPKWRHYLCGIKFELYTHYKNLKYLNFPKGVEHALASMD